MTGFIKSKSYRYTKHLYEKKIWEKENNKKLNLKKFIKKKKKKTPEKIKFDEMPVIDHDHSLGDRKMFKKNPNLKPRGLLCHHCNRGMGALKDDPKLVRKTLEYLEK